MRNFGSLWECERGSGEEIHKMIAVSGGGGDPERQEMFGAAEARQKKEKLLVVEEKTPKGREREREREEGVLRDKQ